MIEFVKTTVRHEGGLLAVLWLNNEKRITTELDQALSEILNIRIARPDDKYSAVVSFRRVCKSGSMYFTISMYKANGMLRLGGNDHALVSEFVEFLNSKLNTPFTITSKDC